MRWMRVRLWLGSWRQAVLSSERLEQMLRIPSLMMYSLEKVSALILLLKARRSWSWVNGVGYVEGAEG
jgi:hypothetical protein